ncbi:PDZ domain-containing protein [Flavobacterium sp.]|uniref:PDZ domain-containing protein n=1 Tax=Flavobacterium sp. TaxID=239 RepID=UPI002613A2E6|nr:PDZ domain-containing protein [Flavobacterium sp.]MDD3003936.1 PDZ domain-containing protein [Flavobacterium sp.]
MKFFLITFFSFYCWTSVYAQEGFVFPKNKKSIKLPFKLVNNLIILPIKVNGIELNFLVDTGVEETLLFSLDDQKQIPLYDVEKIKLVGLGSQDAIDGLKSFKNTLTVGDLIYPNHEIIVILDQNFNFSSTLGIEVNGIIGHRFFNHNLVKIDYQKKRIHLYSDDFRGKEKLISKLEPVAVTLEKSKPYITIQIALENQFFEAKCLVDSGNSDGLWLFESKSDKIKIPDQNFEDYLGRGFSGDIFGKRAMVSRFMLNRFSFQEIIGAFPDAVSLANVKMVDQRVGSIGGEVLKRFNVIFDYKNAKMYLQKNSFYNEKFRYNTTGITLHHSGLQWYKEEISINTMNSDQPNPYLNKNATDLKYKFKLLPIYEILIIRKNSPAEKAGLKVGDVVMQINNNRIYKMTLERINKLLRVDHNENITLLVMRDGKEIKFKFKVEDLLQH